MMASPCAHRTSALASGQALAARRSSRRNASVLAPAVRAQAPAHGEGEGAALQRRQPAQALPPLSKLPPVLSGCGRKDQVGSAVPIPAVRWHVRLQEGRALPMHSQLACLGSPKGSWGPPLSR